MNDPLSEKLARNAEKSRQLELGRVLDEPLERWPTDARAAPNALIRCALFRASRGARSGERPMHQGTLVASLGGMKIVYRGEDLDQKDLDIWMAVLQLYRSQKVSEVIQVTAGSLLTLAGLSNTGPNHKILQERLKRLNFTQIEITAEDESTSKFAFYGPLIQRAERNHEGSHWEISLAPRVRALFTKGYTWIDWEVRQRLRRSPLAQWLHSFYRSHRHPYNISVEKLWELSGSGTQDLRFFRSDLKKALRRVQEACSRYQT